LKYRPSLIRVSNNDRPDRRAVAGRSSTAFRTRLASPSPFLQRHLMTPSGAGLPGLAPAPVGAGAPPHTRAPRGQDELAVRHGDVAVP